MTKRNNDVEEKERKKERKKEIRKKFLYNFLFFYYVIVKKEMGKK